MAINYVWIDSDGRIYAEERRELGCAGSVMVSRRINYHAHAQTMLQIAR